MPPPDAVVITGMGAVSPLGRTVEALWQGLLAGRQGFQEIPYFDASPLRNRLAGIVEGYAYARGGPPRATQMLLDAAREALTQALGGTIRDLGGNLGGDHPLQDTALICGTNFGGMTALEEAVTDTAGAPASGDLTRYLFGHATRTVAATLRLAGPQQNVSLSCASGTAVLGLGLDWIRLGRARRVLCCGYDELSLFSYAGLSALRAITPETIRPFDLRRKGTLFAEGAGALLLERAADAEARGAPALARVAGRFMNNDGYHMTAPEQTGAGIQRLMRGALHDAGWRPEEVDGFNLHATGTEYNDKIETLCIREVFGARGLELPVSAVKSALGHTMGAAGTLESIVAVRGLQEQTMPPVLGLDPAQQDPACGVHAPVSALAVPGLRRVLKTSYGFGGTNAAVCLERGSP